MKCRKKFFCNWETENNKLKCDEGGKSFSLFMQQKWFDFWWKKWLNFFFFCWWNVKKKLMMHESDSLNHFVEHKKAFSEIKNELTCKRYWKCYFITLKNIFFFFPRSQLQSVDCINHSRCSFFFFKYNFPLFTWFHSAVFFFLFFKIPFCDIFSRWKILVFGNFPRVFFLFNFYFFALRFELFFFFNFLNFILSFFLNTLV